MNPYEWTIEHSPELGARYYRFAPVPEQMIIPPRVIERFGRIPTVEEAIELLEEKERMDL